MKETQSKADRTKAFIIEKASPLFNTKGYIGTSLNDLIQATGLTKGALYGNFVNKDQLAEEAFVFNFQRLKNGFQQAIQQEELAIPKLIAMLKYSRYGFEKLAAEGGCPVLNTSIEADDQLPFLQKMVREALGQWKNLIANIIEVGKKKGEIKKEVSESQYSSLIISLTEGGIMQAKITGDVNHLFVALDYAEKIIKEELTN